jgi:hypothetical protein
MLHYYTNNNKKLNMKKIAFVAIATLALSSVHADYTVTIPLNSKIQFYSWSTATPLLGDWMNIGNIYDCSNWSPNPSTVTVGEKFNQQANDCKQDQERSVQKRETDSVTGTTRNSGAPYTEYNTITASDLRQAIGSLETWLSISPTYTNWVNSGILNSCTNWSPAPSSVTINEAFTQTATDCAQPQTRYKQEREQETTTLSIRDKGNAILENQNIVASSNRQATGTKETWALIAPTYTEWANNGALNSCTNWSPATTTVTINQSFTQTATDCKQPQTRNKQDREQETTTLEIRNKGLSVVENKIITATSTRAAVGTKESWTATTSTYTNWTNTGSITACSNWAPSPATITIGQAFTQTATDCKQDQTRSRQDREIEGTTGAVRNIGSAVTENQTITVSSTQAAVGTKETWSATTSTYTAWVNNGSVTSCSNWTPAPATVTIGQAFTQTATDCQQAQTRSRQDREQETTTGAVRNKGVAVTENQTITTSSTRSSTGTKETWVATTPTSTDWVNSGAVTGCSNWTPDPSTVAAGTGFTQTATNCSQSQTRSTQNRDRETTTGAIRNNGSAFTETQSITVSSTRSATGTKIVQECNGQWILHMSNANEIRLYGPTTMVAYWAGKAFYTGQPKNFSNGGYNYVLQGSTSGSALCRS